MISAVRFRERLTNKFNPEGSKSDGLSMSMCVSSNSAHGYGLQFYVAADIANMARLSEGQRVDLLFDGKSMRGKLSAEDCGNRLVGQPSSTKLKAKYTWYPGFPSCRKIVELQNLETADGVISFDFPDSVTFQECARDNNKGE